MTSSSSSFVTPLLSARWKWPTCCSLRLSAINAAQVIRLRSRLLRPLRSQTSPNSTLSVRSTSLGANCRSASRAADELAGGLDMVTPSRLDVSRAGVADEALRRPVAPLRAQALLGADQVAAVGGVEPIGVGPALVHAAPRILPVVVDLAAQQMAADAPHVLVLAEALDVLVVLEHAVDVLDLVGDVVQPDLRVVDAEQHMMVDILLAAIEPAEGADDVLLVAGIDVIGAQHAQRVAEPRHGLLDLGRRQHAMADALDRGRRLGEPHHPAGAPHGLARSVQLVARHLHHGHALHAVDDLDLVAVRLGEPHALAAARLVERLDAGGAGQAGGALEVILVRRVVGEADELCAALLHRVQMMVP